MQYGHYEECIHGSRVWLEVKEGDVEGVIQATRPDRGS